MAREETITPQRVREVLSYDPETGVLTWKAKSGTGEFWEKNWNQRCANKSLQMSPTTGYIRLTIDNVYLAGHRVAFCHYHGRWPAGKVDHINRNRIDNRIANLREATDNQNAWNCGVKKNNTSGHPGVSFDKRRGQFEAYIMKFRRRKHLGYFSDFDQACAVRRAAEAIHHGEFAAQKEQNI